MMNKKYKHSGFTLIELMISIVVMSILAVMVMPGFYTFLMKGRRSDGITTLIGMQLAQEEFRMKSAAYGTIATVWNNNTVSPGGHYQLNIVNNTATGFIATATALNGQADDKEKGTSCAVLSLTVNGINVTKAPADCWVN